MSLSHKKILEEEGQHWWRGVIEGHVSTPRPGIKGLSKVSIRRENSFKRKDCKLLFNSLKI